MVTWSSSHADWLRTISFRVRLSYTKHRRHWVANDVVAWLGFSTIVFCKLVMGRSSQTPWPSAYDWGEVTSHDGCFHARHGSDTRSRSGLVLGDNLLPTPGIRYFCCSLRSSYGFYRPCDASYSGSHFAICDFTAVWEGIFHSTIGSCCLLRDMELQLHSDIVGLSYFFSRGMCPKCSYWYCKSSGFYSL